MKILTAVLSLGIVMFDCLAPGIARAEAPGRMVLNDGWEIESSAKIQARGETISTAAFTPDGWHPATVPSTVAGCLVEDKVYPNPFFAMNLRSLPGMDYSIGVNFSQRAMSVRNPFRVSWWYRKEFQLSLKENDQTWLDFDGINYRANIWLNGKLIADTNQVVGAYRTYDLNITHATRAGRNVLAVEVFPPQPNSLAITWVDWNPAPPDKNMGLWRDVTVSTTGPVALRYPQVITAVDTPSLAKAHLTVSAEISNPFLQPVTAILEGNIHNIEFAQSVSLDGGQSKRVTFTPDKFPQLNIKRPRLWWPAGVGPQNLYDLNLRVRVEGLVSDQQLIHFGIRQASSDLNDKGYRVFKINGKPILIRGGGWAPDLFLRSSAEREIQEIRYVKDMRLNTIRFEGKTESDRFLELCDRQGIMVIAGWCCCDYWENWNKWNANDYSIATESLRSQIRRIRNHPCLITWWYGSDNAPDERAERNYLDVLKELNWPNSVQSSASAARSKIGQPTGIRMTGPYEYVPPIYWYVDTHAGGAYCFNTETSPGPAIPPIESLRRMLPKEHLWPIDNYWNFHCGGGAFKNLNIFTEALNKRLGQAAGMEDYARKAQIMSYDGERAMFEAYARNKYDSTGVIQWMMNNAWPSMIWHLYDYYLRPGGGYFGAKKACELLHIQYSYDDRSVVVVNGSYQPFQKLKATASIYNLDMTKKYSQQTVLDIGPDESKRAFTLPEPAGLTSTYFARLALEDSSGKTASLNFYWLSTRPDTLGEPKEGSDWYYTPTKQFADFTALNTLPEVDLKVSSISERKDDEETTRVTIENPGNALAFFVHLKVNRGNSGQEILPILWEDNYFSLMPGEEREITASYAASLLQDSKPVIEMDAWNAKTITK